MIAFALDAIFSFSNLPIRIGTYIGISLIMSTVPLIVYIVYLKVVLHTSPPGMPTILSAILFIGGIQIFMLGLLGEYIGKIYDEVKKRPLYIVDEVLNLESMN